MPMMPDLCQSGPGLAVQVSGQMTVKTIFKVVPVPEYGALSWAFGRDGEIRTRGLLLPKQAR
jgi:hypothetical protein